jgi:hypothetical protein
MIQKRIAFDTRLMTTAEVTVTETRAKKDASEEDAEFNSDHFQVPMSEPECNQS